VLAVQDPPRSLLFEHVYREPHPLIAAEQAWLADYEASYGESS
jgi:2-oxoisovalerate dehydrogenase E1 component alpha subunit